MNKNALQDIQQALNAIRAEIERVYKETKLAVLEFMLGASNNLLPLVKKMAKPETKIVTHTVAVPKTRIAKKPRQPQTQTPKSVSEPKDLALVRP